MNFTPPPPFPHHQKETTSTHKQGHSDIGYLTSNALSHLECSLYPTPD